MMMMMMMDEALLMMNVHKEGQRCDDKRQSAVNCMCRVSAGRAVVPALI